MPSAVDLLKRAIVLRDLSGRARQLFPAFKLEADLANVRKYAEELDAQALALEEEAAQLVSQVGEPHQLSVEPSSSDPLPNLPAAVAPNDAG